MQNVSINGSGMKIVNMVSGNDVNIGYSLPFNYLDDQVDFDGININSATYALGYSYSPNPNLLTHFNGVSACDIGLFATTTYPYKSNMKFPLVRNFCHIKSKYISISGTSIAIGVTNSLNLYQDNTSAWEIVGSIKYMVKTHIPNVKYVLTSLVKDNLNQGGIVSTREIFNAGLVESSSIFPMYFPKRDTLMLTGNKLDQV